MKLSTILCFTGFALVDSRYYVLRRGFGAELRGFRPAVRPNARIAANEPKLGAWVGAKGPAKIYHTDANGKQASSKVPDKEIGLRKSTHSKRPSVGAIVEGPLSNDHHIQVSAHGKYASLGVVAPPGGSGKIKLEGDGEPVDYIVKGGESKAGAVSSKDGVAKAYASVSRPGEAHASGFQSATDVMEEEIKEDQRPRHY